jgi:hypothetical protein
VHSASVWVLQHDFANCTVMTESGMQVGRWWACGSCGAASGGDEQLPSHRVERLLLCVAAMEGEVAQVQPRVVVLQDVNLQRSIRTQNGPCLRMCSDAATTPGSPPQALPLLIFMPAGAGSLTLGKSSSACTSLPGCSRSYPASQ